MSHLEHGCVALTGLTIAEYFRDVEGQTLCLSTISSRFTQAGSKVSALFGTMPSAVGYQPTLATEMGQLQERINNEERFCYIHPSHLCASR